MSERTLTDADVDALAEKLITSVHAQKHAFWIDPEQHYADHSRWKGFDDDQIRSLHDLIKAYRTARGTFWKAFLGLAIVGAVAMMAVGLGFKS